MFLVLKEKDLKEIYNKKEGSIVALMQDSLQG